MKSLAYDPATQETLIEKIDGTKEWIDSSLFYQYVEEEIAQSTFSVSVDGKDLIASLPSGNRAVYHFSSSDSLLEYCYKHKIPITIGNYKH